MAGFLEDAGVDVNEVPDSPFDFGNEFWPVQIVHADDPKPTKNGQRYGFMITWVCTAPNAPQTELGRKWMQLPVPEALWDEIPWDKNSPEGKKVLAGVGDLYRSLGFPVSQWAKIGRDELIGAGCLTKISPKKNDEGFWQFNFYGMKPFPQDGSAEGTGVFTPKQTEGSIGSAIEDELNNI